MSCASNTQAMNTQKTKEMYAAPKTREAYHSTMKATNSSPVCTLEQSRIGCIDLNGACMMADNFEMKYNPCPKM